MQVGGAGVVGRGEAALAQRLLGLEEVAQRFAPVADLLFEDLLLFGDPSTSVEVLRTTRLEIMAQVLTWWTIIIEAVVAVLFLWPEDRGPSRWRDLTLLAFIVTTYPVAPVIGFAWVLASMGVAQSTEQSFKYGPVLYVVLYIFVMLSVHLPVARLFSL